VGDGNTTTFTLPNNNGYDPSTMQDNEAYVYVNNVKLVLDDGYVVNPYDGFSSTRTITFTTAPATGAKILLSVSTGADYRVTGALGNLLTFLSGHIPSSSDIIEIVSWNDTSEQGLLTEVFVGPSTNNNNTFDLGRVIDNPERLLVTMDGSWLFNGLGYRLEGTSIVINGPTIDPSSVIAITSFTNSTVAPPMAFRIFQDMRGVQATYRITPSTTTTLVAPLAPTDDVIYVNDASTLSQPNFAVEFNINIVYNIGDIVIYNNLYYVATATTVGHLPTDPTYWQLTSAAGNVWGVLTVAGERIMYRHRDTVANTVSGLLRGTAGTAVGNNMGTNTLTGTPLVYPVGSDVYDMSRGNLAPDTCQNYIETNVTYPLESGINLADGITTTFTLDADISEVPADVRNETVEIYLGGTQVESGYTITADTPVTVEFDVAPPAGVEVAILVRRGHSWYGLSTPNLPLNETDTLCARFLRGE
jgi:hypothetical protein